MKIDEITTTKAYLRIELVSGGMRITPLHLYPDCYHLVRPSDASRKLIEVDPQVDFRSRLLDGLRVCENCRQKFERLKREQPLTPAEWGARFEALPEPKP